MSKKKLFLIIGAFWLVLLAGFIGFKEYTLKTGDEMLLKTVPVDPRDLFRGDYVTLRYEISTLDAAAFSKNVDQFKEGDRIYVFLEVGGDKIAHVVGIGKQAPAGGKYIKGTIEGIGGGKLNVKYGIESYFIPEGKGGNLGIGRKDLYGKISLDSSGNPILKTLISDGKELQF